MLILRTTRTAQPAQPSGVDWTHPSARGLIVAIAGSKPYELVNGIALRSEGGPTMVGATPGMAGPRFNGSSGVLWAPIPRIALGNWTLLQVVRGNSPATDRRSFNVGNSGSTTIIVAIGTGSANAAKVRAVGVNDAGTAPGDTSQVSAADAFVSSGPRAVALRYLRNSGYQAFVNGVPDGFADFVDPSSTYTVDRVGVGAMYRTGAAAFFAGDSFASFAWARGLSDEEVSWISRNPWQLFAPEPRRIWVPAPAAGSYTLTAETGAFTLTGNDAGTLFGRRLVADQQSYALTGNEANLLFGRRLTADQATFTVNGNDAGLIAARRLTADAATFTLTGNDAGLVYAPAGVYTLTADTGSFALTGSDAGLIYAPLNNYVLTAETGGFSLTGNDAGLQYSGAPAPVPAPAQQGAGRSRKRRRYTVEIDGQEYDVASPAEAEAILKAKAEKAAQEAVERAQKAERRPGRKVLADARKSLTLPTVSLPAAAPSDLTAGINASLEAVRELYESTLRTIEIAALLRKQRQDEEDDEEVLMLLL